MNNVLCILIAYFIGAAIGCFVCRPEREWESGYNAAKSIYNGFENGFKDGYNTAKSFYHDYDKGFGDGFEIGWEAALEDQKSDRAKEDRETII